ncbi:acetyl-CoA carboxylase biotin carboxylase subunit [Flavobacteriales bacterium]|nr:acetyl-CoA carboxylase biotin carboxylase subunit [Flavobacteriales bacterium]MDC3337394.1 acetyl-CoA carboxylase biotin carboxylase subunit [Flavobacteriales bacterium]
MNKILIANRGEIALRIMRSCKEMGIATVAIYSEVDRNAPFVKYADEAVCVGPAASSESYLRGDKIIAICKDLKVDGIHPGYGFLSENADFTRAVTAAGITFIGPSPEAMEVMGSKLAAKDTVRNYDIPMIEGTDQAITDIAEAKKRAGEIGFPILIKASAGGGGKGMRVVEDESQFEEQMNRAVSEAVSAFGDGSVFIERFVEKPRHIEIQILADTFGNVVYLFDRECSIQRRHQKVIEEAPSSCLTDALRAKMGKAACDVAKACNYYGAGTVEFLYEDGEFFFLEMNTRLQVEHPVTEMITGIDLVKEQVNIANGNKLPFEQSDLSISGHSIEVRVYAEDPRNNFLPDIGKLERYRRPSGMGVRVDDGFEEGMEIPIYYDPMISKLIVYGSSRDEAISKMLRAIKDYEVVGVETTLPFCSYAIDHEAFRSGNFSTKFVDEHFTDPEVLDVYFEDEAEIAKLFAVKYFNDHKRSGFHIADEQISKWKLNRI